MLEFLKVKLFALGAESRFISKKERHFLNNARALSGSFSKKHQLDAPKPEKPAKVQRAEALEDAKELAQRDYDIFWGLQHHRKNVVRKEARDTHIAYCFLRGRAFEDIERTRYTNPDWKNIERMVLTFGEVDERILKQQFEEWVQQAKAIIPKNWNFAQ